MYFGNTPITPADMVGLIETYAKQASGLPPDCVFLSIAPERWHLEFPPSDQFISIFPERFPVWQGVIVGAGLSYSDSSLDQNLGYDLSVKLTVYTRFNTDEQFRSSAFLRNTSLGVLGVVNRLVTAFQIWTAPVPNETDQSYLREPARITGGPNLVPRDFNKTLWALCHTDFEFKHTTKLSPSQT